MMSRVIRAESLIDAPRERVWAVLVDFDQYGTWNPFTPQVCTRLEVGAPVDMKVRLWTGERAQREYVTHVTPGERICWGMHMGARWLVRAERCQWLEALDDGRTRYVTEDRLQGALTPLVLALYGHSMQRGFEGVARALQRRAEQGA